ncbi:putative transporter [Lasiodiplodia hormozganensis]|uniref:Transporter n=1 Tax=Lasiodiplodia hormozganensis TaxID=869390 RepID=A0AA39XZ79_9PEZI|nr:putative transporter [Lasiodiplodia hormozganensis]
MEDENKPSEQVSVSDKGVGSIVQDPNTNRLALAQALSPEDFAAAEASVKKKLDVRLLLTVWVIFIMNYLDRNNIAAAKVSGIKESLELSSTQYSTAVAVLFAGYVSMQIPSNIFLTKLRPSIYIPTVMAIWGILSCCTGVVKGVGGLYACRFFLGVVEAAFYPGALFLISSWYRRSELGVRCAILFSGSQLGSAFSGLIGAGIQHGLDGKRGMESWRWLFIIEGSITVFIALCAILILPDWPSNTRWLTPTERAVAEWRLICDAGQVDEDDEAWSYGFKMAFVDWRLYLFAFMFLCIQVASATSNFFPSVVETLGFSKVNTLLLTVPPYIISLTVTIFNNKSADHFHNSSFHVMWPLAMAIVGFVVAAATLNTGARYFAMILMVVGGHGSNAVVVAWTQKTMLRPRVKRAAAVAFVNAIGNTSQVFSSYLYPDESAPRYTLAMSANSAFALVGIFMALLIRLVLQKANRDLERGTRSIGEVMVGEAATEISGITEEEREARKNGFRYIT